ncbi:MAG TPA: 50S ribosomal protein L29 [Candidatus Binataceae bacterium]|nr:50S ribosomal protein L29 [Candidatus Binataceae bacterium]
MELSELRQMSATDLRIKEREAREEVFKLRLKLRTNQLESRTNYYNARRELARILTLLQEQAKSAATAASANAAARKG